MAGGKRTVIMKRITGWVPGVPYHGRETVTPILQCGHVSERRFFPDNKPKRGRVGCRKCFKDHANPNPSSQVSEVSQVVVDAATTLLEQNGELVHVVRINRAELSKAELASVVAARKMANAEVGDFITDLMTAIKYKSEWDLTQGDVLSDPVRGYTDGRAFSREYKSESNGKLRVTISLDTSSSMYDAFNGQFWTAAPVFHKIDMMMREAQRSLPAGTLQYQPFLFGVDAFRIPEVAIPWVCTSINNIIPDHLWKAIQDDWRGLYDNQIIAGQRPRLVGGGTWVSSLFEEIRRWEQTDPEFDCSATCIDIILTDGDFKSTDVDLASKVQVQRSDKTITTLLNFVEPYEMLTPERCTQHLVSLDNLTDRIRTILTEALQQM